MSNVSRLFGSSGTVTGGKRTSSAVIYKGTIDDATVVTLSLEPGGIYELYTAEYNASTLAYRGHRQINIKAPEPDLFGTVACAYGNAYASTNSGVTIGYPTDSTITIARSSATYAVIYVLRAVGVNIGNPSSIQSEAETARDQAQIYANQAATSATNAEASATAAESAVEHYPYIDSTTGNWMVWDSVNSVWLDTGIHAQGAQGIQGEKGDTGVGIDSVTKASGTGAAGTTDIYNVNLDDGTVAGQFSVYNGQDGQGSPGSQLPLPDGTASAGSANAYAREDHVHPIDTETYYDFGTISFGQDPGAVYDGTARHSAVMGVGEITDSGKEIVLTFVLPKRLRNVSNIAISAMLGGMRGVKGYINSTANNTDWLSILQGSGYTYGIHFEGNQIWLDINKTSAFTNYTNNTPIVFTPNYIEFVIS